MVPLPAGSAVVLVLALAACATAPPATPAASTLSREDACATRATGDALTPRFLEGTWAAELQVTSRELRYQPPSEPHPVATVVRGTMELGVSIAESRRDSALAPDAPLRGTLHARLDSLLARTPPGWTEAGVRLTHHSIGTAAGAFGMLVGDDRCADCGHLFLRGIRQGDVVCGIWRQRFLGTGDRGTFMLRRRASAPR